MTTTSKLSDVCRTQQATVSKGRLRVLQTMDTLPEIPRQTQSLTGRQTTRSAPSIGCNEDSGLQLDLRESLASASRQSAAGMRPVSSGGTRSPNPPSYSRPSTVSPRSMQSMRKSMDSVRLSRSEWTRKEQLINTLRSDNLQLQQRVRELEHSKENSLKLQTTCSKLAQLLGCSLEGVATESVSDILRGKISALIQDCRQATQQADTSRAELERARGDLAATNVRCTSLQSQQSQTKSELDRKEAEVAQLKSEMEQLQQTCARTGATVQSLRQQLTEAEQSKSSQSVSDQLTELQTEVGRLRTELSWKSDEIENQKSQLSAKQADLEIAQERATTAETMYADLCAHLMMALQLETEDSFDSDFLISQVSNLVEECSELKLKMDTITSSMRTVELDSKANRETILRLVAEAKSYEKQASQIEDLKKSKDELKALMVSKEREKEGLEERLLAAKETLLAQEKELQAKDLKIDSLSQKNFSLSRHSESERSLADSAEQKYQELCESLRHVLGAETKDSSSLLSSVCQLLQDSAHHGDELLQQSSELSRLQDLVDRLQTELAQCNERLRRESAKVKQLEGNKMTDSILTEGLSRELEKHKAFTKRLSKAVNLDSGTAEILSGDFAHDAILTRAEQLTKNETQMLAEKQTAVYNLQRKLKSSRQSLDSKELHLGLVQRKVTMLEERLLSYAQREEEWRTLSDKMKKMEKQLEHLQTRATQQKETIIQLREENAEVQRLKAQKGKLEDRVSQLLSNLEDVSQARVHQAHQLADARQRQSTSKTQAIVANSQDRAEIERLRGELERARRQLGDAKQKEAEMSSFKAAVDKLLRDSSEGTVDQEGDNPDEYSLIAKLEKLMAIQQKSKQTTKCLEASLRQLESGFKSSYNDALTLLTSSSV